MDFHFKSSNIKQLTDIAQDFQTYVNDNTEVYSKDLYIGELVKNTITKRRKLPSNIGTTYICHSPNNQICKICGQKLKQRQQLRELTCKHIFHKKCIDNWLIDNELRCIECNTFSMEKY